MNYVLTGIGLTTVIIAAWISWKRFGTCYTPWFLLWAAQVGSLSIYYLKQYSLASDLQPITWVAIFSFIGSFFIGNAFAAKLIPKSSLQPIRIQPDNRTLVLFFLCAGLTLFGMSIGYFKIHGWPMFMNDKEASRLTFASIPWYGSYSFQAVTTTGFLGLFFLINGSKKWKYPGLVGVLIILWIAGAIGMRGYLIFAFVIGLAIWDSQIRPVSPQKLVAAIGVILSVFLAIFLVRFSDAAFSDLSSHISFSAKLEIVFKPLYIYFSNNYWNLDSEISKLNVSHQQIFSPGYWTLTGLFYFTNFPGTLNNAYGFSSQYSQLLKVDNLNTSPIQWNFYADWGWPGLLFGGFVYGFIAWYFFQKRKATIFHLVMYVVFSLSCALSFFVNAFVLPDIFLLICLAFLLRFLPTQAKLRSTA